MERKFAVIESNKVVNVVINVSEEELSANPEKYIEYTNGWNNSNGVDGSIFFPVPNIEESLPE